MLKSCAAGEEFHRPKGVKGQRVTTCLGLGMAARFSKTHA